jgi:hypothetical protein
MLQGEEETYGAHDRQDQVKDGDDDDEQRDEEEGMSRSDLMKHREEELKASMSEASYEKFCKKRA